MKFEVIVNDFFENLKQDTTLTRSNNKKVLWVLNDFADGKWRYEKFQKFICDNIKETALSHSERKALLSDGESSLLTESAKKLRLVEAPDAIGRGSEIAEIVLYGIMKHHYKALPIVPKIFYKQNNVVRAKPKISLHYNISTALILPHYTLLTTIIYFIK